MSLLVAAATALAAAAHPALPPLSAPPRARVRLDDPTREAAAEAKRARRRVRNLRNRRGA